MLGNGVIGSFKCPTDEFLYQLTDSKQVEFFGTEMSCSKMVHSQCGAPSIEVIDGNPEEFFVWYLEFDTNRL